MILSFNEIEALTSKATRGAGLDWGLAEEAAFAARWLAERGLDWSSAVLLRCRSHVGDATQVAETLVRGEALCPLRLGAYLADAGISPRGLTLRDVAVPLLLLPFVARIGSDPLVVAFGRDPAYAIAGAETYSFGSSGDTEAGLSTAAVALTLGALPKTLSPLSIRTRPLPVPASVLDALAVFERQTYVPATAQSRIAGAGAGLSDND